MIVGWMLNVSLCRKTDDFENFGSCRAAIFDLRYYFTMLDASELTAFYLLLSWKCEMHLQFPISSSAFNVIQTITVVGRIPAPFLIYETLWNMGCSPINWLAGFPPSTVSYRFIASASFCWCLLIQLKLRLHVLDPKRNLTSLRFPNSEFHRKTSVERFSFSRLIYSMCSIWYSLYKERS